MTGDGIVPMTNLVIEQSEWLPGKMMHRESRLLTKGGDFVLPVLASWYDAVEAEPVALRGRVAGLEKELAALKRQLRFHPWPQEKPPTPGNWYVLQLPGKTEGTTWFATDVFSGDGWNRYPDNIVIGWAELSEPILEWEGE